jgi:hypothetical protein
MSDIFEVDPADRDVYLEELFMRANPDTVEVSFYVYDTNRRSGMSPEAAFRSTISELGEVPDAFIENRA